MKKALSISMIAIVAAMIAAPTALAGDPPSSCVGSQCSSTPPPPPAPTPDWEQTSGAWAGSHTFGGAMTFGEAIGGGEGNVTREGGTTGFSEVLTGSSFNVANCGTCAEGAFTGNVFGSSQAGQLSVMSVTGNGNVQGGTSALGATELGGEFFAGRYRSSTTSND